MAAGEERRKQALLHGPIRRVQRRLNLEIWANGLVAPAWSAATLFALCRLLLRTGTLAAALVAVIACAVFCAVRVWPRRVSLEQAAAIADRSAELGGLLLTRLERPVGAWELGLNDRIRKVPSPKVALRRPLALVGLSIAFLGLVLAIPLPQVTPRSANAAAASKLAAVEAKAEALAQEAPVGDEIRAELERLRGELADGRFDAADWEAADGVEAALEQKAADAAADLAKAAAAAKALEEALAAEQGAEAGRAEREELERALAELGDGKASGTQRPGGEQGEQGQRQQGTGSAQSPAGGRTPSEVADLRRALERRQEQLQKGFDQRPGGGKPRDADDLERERLAEQRECDGTGPCQGTGKGKGKRGGKKGTGVGRGGDSEELTFAEGSEFHPEKLKFAPLPQGQGGEARELWGLRAADPSPDTEGVRGRGSGAVAEGEQAPGRRTGPLLPRNRELVQRYFDAP